MLNWKEVRVYFIVEFADCCTMNLTLITELEQGLDDFKLSHQQKWDQIRNHIKNIRSKLSDEVLSMTMNEMDDLLQNHAVKNYAQAQGFQSRYNNPLLNITNTTMNSILCNSVRKTSRTDDGKSIRFSISFLWDILALVFGLKRYLGFTIT